MKKPFKIRSENTDYHREALYNIEGFWSTDSVRLIQCKNWDREWEDPEISWGSGGKDGSVNNVQSAENFAAAILNAVKVANLWKKQP